MSSFTEQALARADLNCFVRFDARIAEQAETAALHAKGPLQGLALAVKDNIDVAGLPTSAGTPSMIHALATHTAPVIARLSAAGAWVLGKANMHELAFGVTSRNAAFGFVQNPLNPAWSAGGSSGGSAAAVAAGIVPAAIGTDTGGSIRIPAAFCGIVGFRPSTGRYSNEGVVPLAMSRDTIGLMARTVALVEQMDRCITGSAKHSASLQGMRLGVPRGFLTEDLDAEIDASWRCALEMLQAAGATVIDVDVPELWGLIDLTSPLITRFELRRDLPVHLLPRTAGLTAQQFVDSIASPDVRGLFEMMLSAHSAPSAIDYERARSQMLPRMRDVIARTFQLNGLDAWVLPTVPVPPFPLDADREIAVNGVLRPLFMTGVRNMQQASLIGMPSISLPMTRAQMPAGLTVEAVPGDDSRLLAIAAAIEKTMEQGR